MLMGSFAGLRSGKQTGEIESVTFCFAVPFGLSQEKLLVELKRKREKTTAELKEARAGKREADKRCRVIEGEKEAICDDYESRLQQQVLYSR